MGNFSNVFFIWAVWFKCYHCQDSVSIQQSPAKVSEGDQLTLYCTYTGSNSPFSVIWYINNIASDMTVRISTCTIVGTPVSDYEVSRYSFTCTNPYTLKISQTSLADNEDVWGCTVGILGVTSPSVSQTKLSITKKDQTTSAAGMEPKQDNLALIVGVSVGGFTLILLVIIIICCCCPGCCLYSSCRKEERKKDSKQIWCNQDVNNQTNANHSGISNATNVPDDKLCMSDVIQTCTSE